MDYNLDYWCLLVDYIIQIIDDMLLDYLAKPNGLIYLGTYPVVKYLVPWGAELKFMN